MDIEKLDPIASIIVDSAYHIHRRIGPGLLESAYQKVLAADLRRRGLNVQREKPVSIEYDGIVIRNAYKVDLFVEDQIMVEVKSVDKIIPVYEKQALTYLRLLNCPLGFLINFGALLIGSEIKRYRNGY